MKACGCGRTAKAGLRRTTTDAPIEAKAEELRSIRDELAKIEPLLSALFGESYAPGPASEKAREAAAELIDEHFNGIVEEWVTSEQSVFGYKATPARTAANLADERLAAHLRHERLTANLSNALVRFVNHLRDRNDLTTYLYLRNHCQEGMLSRALPSQFNVVHIALKQIILSHVHAALRGPHMEVVRDAVVAAIDERRLMVGQFYIESRERALRASEEKYRNTIDHAPDPMYQIEAESWKVLGTNAAADRLHARMDWETPAAHRAGNSNSPPSEVGFSLLDLVPEEMRHSTEMHLRRVMQLGSDETLDLPLKDRYFDVHSALIPYGNRQFIQMILHDVTQRREMLDQLLKTERLATAGTFSAGVAHEVNNPLASISSLVQSLLSGESDPSRRENLHTILAQITRISTTLKGLVNFARPSGAQRQVVNLNELIQETLRLVAYNKRFGAIRIETSLAPDLKPVFAVDNEIQQVLLNLLLNAADATPQQGGVIRVVTENQAEGHNGERMKRVVMRVIDNGIGIPREHIERVFDPFFTTKPAGSGAGLGLSLCQRIILSNRGSIRVDSAVGKGTTITILLPEHEASSDARAAAAAV
jgi:signal transduction histidine kinase